MNLNCDTFTEIYKETLHYLKLLSLSPLNSFPLFSLLPLSHCFPFLCRFRFVSLEILPSRADWTKTVSFSDLIPPSCHFFNMRVIPSIAPLLWIWGLERKAPSIFIPHKLKLTDSKHPPEQLFFLMYKTHGRLFTAAAQRQHAACVSVCSSLNSDSFSLPLLWDIV